MTKKQGIGVFAWNYIQRIHISWYKNTENRSLIAFFSAMFKEYIKYKSRNSVLNHVKAKNLAVYKDKIINETALGSSS